MDFAEILFYGLPLLVVLFFIFSLIRYLTLRHGHRKTPEAVPEAAVRTWRNVLMVAGGMLGVLLAVVVAFTLLLMMAVAYM